jgi:ATP-dependent 26S proteasome regulatory subunit
MLDNEIKAMRNESNRLSHEHTNVKERIKENNEKIKLNKQLPYLVGNVVEVSSAAVIRPSLCCKLCSIYSRLERGLLAI